VLCFGDFYCMMQGKYDPRRDKTGVRPEHNVSNYLDVVHEDTATLLAPYADNLLMFSDGNHETSILKRLETNPLDNLAIRLNYKSNATLHRMGYHGFVKFIFERNTGGGIQNYLLYFHHGSWGGVITKGALGVSRYASIVPQADCIVTGHTHDRWKMSQPRYHLKQNGEVIIKEQSHIKTGTYKEEFAKESGWAIERIVMPKSLGGYWMNLHLKNNTEIYAEFVETRS
jgi:hypothetical protein